MCSYETLSSSVHKGLFITHSVENLIANYQPVFTMTYISYPDHDHICSVNYVQLVYCKVYHGSTFIVGLYLDHR